MKLWLLKRILVTNDGMYDCADGFVIRATSETEARSLAAGQSGDEGAQTWLDAEGSTCEMLMTDGDVDVILRDYNAG